MQERVASPSRWTVQEPQSPLPQPNLVPVSPIESRRTQSSGVSGATSTSWLAPLTVSFMACLPLRCDGEERGYLLLSPVGRQSVFGHLDEEPRDAGVSRELGMEGRRQHVAVADEHGRAGGAGEDLGAGPELDEPRGPDEDRGERASGQARLERRLERVDLPPVRVSLHDRVEEAEARLGGRSDLAREEDRSGAGAEERAPLA